MSILSFNRWFLDAFGVQLPPSFARYLAAHPNGIENGFGPKLWNSETIQAETEDRRLIEKGVCIIGASDSIRHFLMRARDGKVFIVDSKDHQSVDAWFADIDLVISLLNLE